MQKHNTMRRIANSLFAGFLLTSLHGLSQTNKTHVTGSVKDKSGKTIQAVSVALMRAKDSSLVKTEVTDAAGKYDIGVANPGNYFLSYTIIGFEKKSLPAFELKPNESYTAPDVTLLPSSTKLNDVTVTSTKKPLIEVRADKTIFNVESSINATGSNALELLQKSPGVSVDNNNNITMKGKTGVKIYIDGKMSQLNSSDLAAYLKSINSNDIEAIEMISNPGAKYDASGNAGIINIKLKKNKKFGTNGSATAGIVQGITPKGNGSVNLNYRDKKVNLFGNIGGNIGNYENTQNLYRIQKDSIYDQKSVQHDEAKSMNVKAGADFFVNSKNTIGFVATTNYGKDTWMSESNTPIYFQPTNQYIKTLTAYNTVPSSRVNSAFNLNYRYADTSGTEVAFDADYGLFRGKSQSYQPNYYYDKNGNIIGQVINKNNTPTDIDIYTAKLDVEQKFLKGKIGYGAKFSYVDTRNTFDFYNEVNGSDIKVLGQSSKFDYTENVNAAYINYQRQFNAKWSIQAGVRMEQTNSRGLLTRDDGIVQADNDVKRSYVNLFPSAAITWTMNEKNSLNLTFSRRIDRPNYQDLNPFENKLDELTYEKGNAFLAPQYTNIVELTHTFMSMLNTTISYSHVSDYATRVTDTLNNATYVQMRNLATQQIIGFSIGSATPIKKWWNGYVNFWYNYQMFNGAIGVNSLNINLSTYGAYLQQTFTLGHDFSAEASGWMNGPSLWGATMKTQAMGGLDLGLQKQLFNKKATAKVSVTDVLATASPWRVHTDFGGLYLDGNGTWESRTLRFTFTYRFGSSQIKSSRQHATGLESESKRIK